MVTYRLIGGDIDVYLDTDASVLDNEAGREFFIVDIRGQDSNDIKAGFKIGIEQYNEGKLIKYARDESIELFSFDSLRNERCLVRQLTSAPAGRFNGSSSRLVLPSLTLSDDDTSLNYPLNIKWTMRFSQDDYNSLVLDSTAYIFSTDESQNAIFFATATKRVGKLEVQVGADLNLNDFTDKIANITDPTDRCLNFDLTFASNTDMTLLLNGEEVAMASLPSTQAISISSFIFYFGALIDGANVSDYFKGVMRNIIITDSNGELVNIVDPSTGVNTGSAANAVPTDITSVTVQF